MNAPAPQTPRRPQQREHHGDVVVDDYQWLRDVQDPAVIAHLSSENDYAEAMTAHLEPVRTAIFGEIRGRTLETDLSVPVADRGWWYFTRTRQGQQYPIRCRVPVRQGVARLQIEDSDTTLDGEQVLVDGNLEAGDSEFFAVGGCEVDHSGRQVGYLVDQRGDERFAIRIKDIDTAEVIDDAVTGTGYGLVWSLDGRYVFYTRVNEAWRPFQVWRHAVGSAAEADVLVYQEDDERFWMGVYSSRDEATLIIQLGSRTTSEVLLLDLADPTGRPRVVAPRQDGLEYYLEPAGDCLLVVHNATHRDFELAWAPLDCESAHQWRTLVTPGPGERIVDVDAFADHAVLSLRSDALSAIRILPRRSPAVPQLVGPAPGTGSAAEELFDTPWEIPVDEPLYSIGVGDNPQWDATTLRYTVESLLTPPTVCEIDVTTRERVVLKQQQVLGEYDPTRYRQERLWAAAPDGTAIPISLVSRADTPIDGTAPGLLYGYGAYEISLDPWFSIPRLSLLDRGVVVAIAHVRGGGELGRSWYEQGRLTSKITSFTDLRSCAEYLIQSGRVAPDRLAVQGGSAGGLLVGATLNLAPDMFRVVLAQVPFVDALTTILDPALPLTVPEWEEWGNPLEDPEVYWYMKRYTPYENIQPCPYPAVLATTSLNDTRVSFAEPAKWVARLRESARPWSVASRGHHDGVPGPFLLRTEMVAGHGGPSGRYDAWEQYAWEMAFVLDQLDATGLPDPRKVIS